MPTLIAGCAPVSKPAGPATTQPVAVEAAEISNINSIAYRTPGQTVVFYLDIYQVEVPIGAVSQSTEFWQRVDEEKVDDPGARDLLLKNGIRVGIAETADWDYFRSLIEQHPHAARSGSAVATGTGTIELLMKKNVRTQDIFLYRGYQQLQGRTYDRCDDLLGVSFWPDPRQEDVMRISISPTIRSVRTILEYNRSNEELPTFIDRRPEFLYQLNLAERIRGDQFLVMGLSSEGHWPTSLGHQFLTLDGDVEKKEQLVLFVPRTRARATPATAKSVPNIDASEKP
jgi:hypothetical protein